MRTSPRIPRSSRAHVLDFLAGYLEAPIKHGHLLDRVALSRPSEDEDVRFLMVLLSLALRETDCLEDRARSLFQAMLERYRPESPVGSTEAESLSAEQVSEANVAESTAAAESRACEDDIRG